MPVYEAFIDDVATAKKRKSLVKPNSAAAEKLKKIDVKKATALSNTNMLPGQLPYTTNPDISSLIINDAVISADVAEAIVDGTITESMTAANQLQIVLQDQSRTLVKSLLADWVKMDHLMFSTAVRGKGARSRKLIPKEWKEIYCTLDYRDFALVQCSKDGEQYTLTFESRAIHELRKYNAPHRWNRDVYTRAMAIKWMCDQVTGYDIQTFIPELHVIEAIATKRLLPNKTQRKATKQKGFAPYANVTVKGVKATAQQKDYLGQVIRTGESMGATYQVLISAIAAVTEESDVSENPQPPNPPFVGMFQQSKADGWPATGIDIPKDATAYYTKAIAANKLHPSWTPAEIAVYVQGSESNRGMGGSQGLLYGQWEKEAKETLKLWGTSATGGSISFSEYEIYYFTRGVSGQREDSWTCIQRLATQVNWSAYEVDNTIWYVDNNLLMEQEPYDVISEDDDGIDEIDFEIDTGKKLNQCTVYCELDRWQTPAGSLVVVEGSGPADGRWLVHDIQRPLFRPNAEITLQLPMAPLAEPTPTSKTISIDGNKISKPDSGNKGVDAVYTKAVEISNQNYPYVWGGGHGSTFDPTSGGISGTVGYDCSGYVSACLSAAHWLDSPEASGGLESWGDPGPGKLMTVWAGPSHVFIEFSIPDVTPTGRPSKVHHLRRADTVPDSSGKYTADGPHVRSQWPPPEPDWPGNFQPRHWPGT